MKKITKWHREFAEKFMNRTKMDAYQLAWFSWFKGVVIGILIMTLFCGCYGTYYVTDTEYDREPVRYYDNQIYSGWSNGYYYYYGMPHYYHWSYYYNACPPYHYHTHTHVVINRPVHTSTHRPNRPNLGNVFHKPHHTSSENKIYVKPNKQHNTPPNTNKNNTVKTNRSNNIKVNTNKNRGNTRINNKVKTNRKPR